MVHYLSLFNNQVLLFAYILEGHLEIGKILVKFHFYRGSPRPAHGFFLIIRIGIVLKLPTLQHSLGYCKLSDKATVFHSFPISGMCPWLRFRGSEN